MPKADLDVRAKKALIRMADTLEDINQKLDYMIKHNGYWIDGNRLAK